MIPTEFLSSVDHMFTITSVGMASWPAPHPDGSPPEDAYSRLANPERYRIVGARAEAWLLALGDSGVATIERSAEIKWAVEPGTTISRIDRATPTVSGALPLAVARSRIGHVDALGITIGVGDPAICVTWLPHCGCDACDDGSQPEIDRLDEWIGGVVAGTFRHLSKGDRSIVVADDRGWSANGSFRAGEVERALRGARGWHEVSGRSWLP